jgi:hypothetical protein
MVNAIHWFVMSGIALMAIVAVLMLLVRIFLGDSVKPARWTEAGVFARLLFANDGPGVLGWIWRVNCEFDYAGRHYQVEPKVHWSEMRQDEAPFWSEEKARRFMEGRISSTGECQLRVKPDDPQESELFG